MFDLMGRTHNSIDGTFCYGMLQYVRSDWGSRGQICVYRCTQCGFEIHNVEDNSGSNNAGGFFGF